MYVQAKNAGTLPSDTAWAVWCAVWRAARVSELHESVIEWVQEGFVVLADDERQALGLPPIDP